jgi:hypothetical protein
LTGRAAILDPVSGGVDRTTSSSAWRNFAEIGSAAVKVA